MKPLMKPIDTPDQVFHDGDPSTGELGTICSAEWLTNVQASIRDIQAECIAILRANGFGPDETKRDQLWEAIRTAIKSHVPAASLAGSGIVQLSSSVTSDSESIAATLKAVKIAMDNANARLAKDRNGADIPNKALFRQSLELGDVATRYIGTRPGTVAAGNDARIIGAVQKTGDTMTGKLTLPQTSGFGVNTDNVLGGSSVTFGDNDTGIKQNGDGILDFYANGQLVARIAPGVLYALNAVRAGDGKKLEVSSSNNSALNARFNLWGNGSDRPTVIELGDDQGWHLYSQRNSDGSVAFSAIGDIHAGGSLHAGGNTIATDGNIYGSLWGGWLNDWLNNQFAARDNNINTRATWDYVNQTFVRDMRLGYSESNHVWRAWGYSDTPPYVITGVINSNTDDLIDDVVRRPLQKNINGTWYNISWV
ncbi:tail fiber protein [Salmonella enterica]|nr:tail fiber protein [Salmonella enterica]EHU6710084.1 tail fiber protein [Salmonella enterica]EMA7243726.1 tail fiber protein [Salmonella enterica]